MNKLDQKRITAILDQANTLLNAGPSKNGQILNIHVLEAVLGDLGRVSSGRDPRELAELVELDLA